MKRTFVVVTFPDLAMARQGISAIKEQQRENGTKIYGAVLAARDSSGELSIQEVVKRGHGHGATAAGAVIGGLAGFALDPIAMMLGAAGGAIVGYAAEVLHEREAAGLVETTSRNLAPSRASALVEIAERDFTEFAAVMQKFGSAALRE